MINGIPKRQTENEKEALKQNEVYIMYTLLFLEVSRTYTILSLWEMVYRIVLSNHLMYSVKLVTVPMTL